MNRARTGQRGEAAAAKFYLDRGCRLLTHNFRTRMGELDVVVQEPDGTIHKVTRRTDLTGERS